ncbi:MAG: thiamine pyrophosphate-dependent enzyme [Candidatus Kapaibacterium sp.]
MAKTAAKSKAKSTDKAKKNKSVAKTNNSTSKSTTINKVTKATAPKKATPKKSASKKVTPKKVEPKVKKAAAKPIATKAATKPTAKKTISKKATKAVKSTKPTSSKKLKMKFGGKDIEVVLHSKFDFKGYKKEQVIDWYKLQLLGRKLDDKAALYLKMAKGWSYHAPFAGHDGIQLALGQIFRASKDYLFPYYRDFMTSLSAGMTPVEIILNGLSKDTDVAGGGRHMSNHFAKPEINIQNVSSCTGNHSQHAAGLGRAIKKYKGDEVVFYSGGDSACAEGYFYEAIASADFDRAPVVFVIQNNLFGISVPLHEVSSNLVVSDNFKGFPNTKIIECDGRDAFDSHRALTEAVNYAKSGKGPAIVHAECDRIGSHSNSDKQDNYRPSKEIQDVLDRDPLMQFRYRLIQEKYLTQKQLEEIEDGIKQKIFDAADEAEAAPNADGKSWPNFIFPEAFAGPDADTEYPLNTDNEVVNYIEGINRVLKEEFRANPNTFMWGQDIGKGGVFNVVKGMPEEFGKDRVFNAPIAEDNIVGSANGFSRYRDDIRLVIEGAEFADYFWPAMEQLIELSHEYWRTRGQFSPNVTLRLASGGYIQGGLYHSQNLEAVFTSIPGIRVVQPAFADDAMGLLRNCIRSKGPTMFLEPKYLYNFKAAAGPVSDEDWVIPFGKGKIRREGTDITVATYGTGVHMSLFAAEKLAEQGVSVEVIDLRSLIPWDKDIIIESVKKTNRLVVVHEDTITGGFGGEIASTISQEAFNYLDAPVMRLGSEDCPVGFAKSYEDEVLINVDKVKAKIEECLNF